MISRAHQLTIGGSFGFHLRRRTKRSNHEGRRPLPYIWRSLMAAAPTVSSKLEWTLARRLASCSRSICGPP
jgi:hypothetical protein